MYVTYFAFYADGSSERWEFPADWTLEEVKRQLKTNDVMVG